MADLHLKRQKQNNNKEKNQTKHLKHCLASPHASLSVHMYLYISISIQKRKKYINEKTTHQLYNKTDM